MAVTGQEQTWDVRTMPLWDSNDCPDDPGPKGARRRKEREKEERGKERKRDRKKRKGVPGLLFPECYDVRVSRLLLLTVPGGI